MTEVVVLSAGCDDIAGNIAARIKEIDGNTGDLLIRSIRSLNEISNKKPDILVLSEDAVKARPKQDMSIKCGILLMPGDRAVYRTASGEADGGGEDSGADIVDIFDADCIVTYGMSPKNTITFSSISEESCVLALQRELVTTKGDVLERQEIKIKGGMRPDSLLAVAGTLLILGQKLSDTNP